MKTHCDETEAMPGYRAVLVTDITQVCKGCDLRNQPECLDANCVPLSRRDGCLVILKRLPAAPDTFKCNCMVAVVDALGVCRNCGGFV